MIENWTHQIPCCKQKIQGLSRAHFIKFKDLSRALKIYFDNQGLSRMLRTHGNPVTKDVTTHRTQHHIIVHIMLFSPLLNVCATTCCTHATK